MTGSSGRAWRLKPVLIVVLAVAVLAAVGYAYASPYVALGRLKSAIDARDSQAVSEYVDFPSLRISLKQQVTEELMRRIDAVKKDNPFAVIGALIGSALIGPLVDAYATPEGVAALMSGIPPRGNPLISAATPSGVAYASTSGPISADPISAPITANGFSFFTASIRRINSSVTCCFRLMRSDGKSTYSLMACASRESIADFRRPSATYGDAYA